MLTQHAMDRLARFAPAERETIAARAEREAAKYPTGRTAIRLANLDMRGAAWSDASNGDTVVAIVLDGRVVTIEYRRSSQPFNRGALRVDRLAIAEDC